MGFKDVNVDQGNSVNLSLWDTFDVRVNRSENLNNGEIVIYPCNIANLRVRYANPGYRCVIFLEDGDEFAIDIRDESDWGNIDTTDPSAPLWGNDDTGYKVIAKVETMGCHIIPISKFVQDVNDQIIYFES